MMAAQYKGIGRAGVANRQAKQDAKARQGGVPAHARCGWPQALGLGGCAHLLGFSRPLPGTNNASNCLAQAGHSTWDLM